MTKQHHSDGPRLGVIGALNMDIHLFDATQEGTGPLTAQHYLAQPGGKGANQARAAARLGASVLLVGCVGEDEFGDLCLGAVRSDGVDTTFVTVARSDRTGFVVIDLVGGHHVTRVFVPGANTRLEWSDVEPALAELATCDAIVTQAEVSGELLDRLAAWSSEAEIPLYLDPSPASAVTPEMLASAEAIAPDSAEAGGLTGRTVETEATARLAAADLLSMGARRVMIKLGSLGTLLADQTRVDLIPTIPVTPEDETGAGDVFLGALVVARSTGSDWPQAVSFANTASALSVSRPGLSLPTSEEVAAVID